VTGDRDLRTFRIWEAGLMDDCPPSIDHTVVAMARDGQDPDAVLGMLMHDVGPWLVPEGDDPVDLDTHAGLLASMADLAAEHWSWDDPLGLTTMEERIRFFAPDNIEAQVDLTADEVPGPITAALEGWGRLPGLAPELSELATRAHAHPEVVTTALATTPPTFLHGDWKMGNLGRHPDGRTILLDWAYPGSGPICWDLGWYLALNRARLPESKEDAIERFRGDLERRWIDTGRWWDLQLSVALFAIIACFGWEKALGDRDELAWWEQRGIEGARRLGW
jgi:hypothetical protein